MAITLFDLDAAPPARIQGGESGLRVVIKRVTFDSSYPNTGGTVGEPITAADLGIAGIVQMFVQPAAGYVFAYDETAGTIKAYRSGASGSALAQVANAVNLSAISTTIVAIGTPSANE
jgi:hypothetical protein